MVIKMEKKGWKITTIILTILLTLTWVFWISMMLVGVGMIDDEIKCANEICFGDEYNSYYYDEYEKTCMCFNRDNEVIHQEVIG